MKRNEFLRTTLAGMAAVAGASAPVFACSLRDTWPDVRVDDDAFWSFVRGQFPLTRDRAYFNTGGLGASPYAVIDAVKAKMDELETISETGHTEALWQQLKATAAAFLDCEPGELAFMRNATEGINVVCNGLPLNKGDEIITSTHEHVANAVPWIALQQRRGISVRFFTPSTQSAEDNLERIRALVTKRTRLISVPHITTTTGQILPIQQISAFARSKGIWLFVDGAQSAGMMPISLRTLGCDAYAACGHKWLLGPKETGFLYVRKDMLETINAKFVGAYSDNGFDFQKGELTFHPSAQRYEYGTVSVPLRVGLGAAFEFLARIGMENVWKRDKQLSNALYDKLKAIPGIRILSPANDAERSAMITFQHDSMPYLEMQAHLNQYKLRTRGVAEGGVNGLRISCHIYNSIEEIDRLVDGVRGLKG